jgi:hypothetical protein
VPPARAAELHPIAFGYLGFRAGKSATQFAKKKENDDENQ